ncbi:Nramp family divalent metal transporter [Nemorincola caseinilytica]|uniref:Divalent metal cation transporter MntH n=1 Tax=Nemorincola caseinilytica TaxID=2054315 RepID=A0ABP8NI71_9BACT
MEHIKNDRSLSEVHGQVDPSAAGGKWKKIFAFFGPAYLVSVGYMDPGNWATDIAGGSQFGYSLVWVLLMSNMMALLLQSLSARLGIVQGRDLAQCSREMYPAGINFILYILAEIAIAACDLAEVLGMAIGLQLLFGIPLLWGVLISLLDTILLLYLQKLGMRKLEAFIITLVAIIGSCFLVEMIIARPHLGDVVKGFKPSLPGDGALFIAIGIIGATVMPHNLYLHSALVQTRKIGRDAPSIKQALRLNTVDSAIALNLAFFVNAAILILAGAVFYTSGHHEIASLQDAHMLLAPLLGSQVAPILFAVALIAAGQSSTVTGTLAGQIIMEGYLRLRINPALRRLLTRLLAIVPAVIVLLLTGETMVDQLLIFSQVLLSMQLAFAVIPLIHFVSDRKKMGDFTICTPTKIAAWLIAAVIVALNLKLFFESVFQWLAATDNIFVMGLILLAVLLVCVLLVVTTIYPFIRRNKEANINVHTNIHQAAAAIDTTVAFRRIALALDFGSNDANVIRYAMQFGNPDASFVLIHVVESASARMMGNEAHDYETREDRRHLDEYVQMFTARGCKATGVLGYKDRAQEIARIVKEQDCDLLIIGSHGHNTAKDIIYGETINTVRHLVKIPLFIAQ